MNARRSPCVVAARSAPHTPLPEAAAGRAPDRGAGVTCVSDAGQGVGGEGSGPQVLVKVERPQRSEDEGP